MSISRTTSRRCLSRLGCNAGTCHGSAQGKNGFKLSLRGYDPIFDVRALTDDQAGRHINLASPDDSMMLLEAHRRRCPTSAAALMQPGEPYYEIMRSWIADGAKLDLTTPRVTKIEVFPVDPVVQRIGSKQQLRVLATYANGEVRDVSREAFLESANSEVAVAGKAGLDHGGAARRGADPGAVRGELCLDDDDRDGRPDRLCLGRAAGLRQDRRAGRRQVEADEDPALRALHRRRFSPPGVIST